MDKIDKKMGPFFVQKSKVPLKNDPKIVFAILHDIILMVDVGNAY